MKKEQWLPADEAVEIIRRRFDASVGRAQAILKRARTSGEVRSEPTVVLDDDGLVGVGVRPGGTNAAWISRPAGVDKDDLLHWLDREAGSIEKPTQDRKPTQRRTQPLRGRAAEAIAALWPAGVPDQAKLPNKSFDSAVNDWLKADCMKRDIPYVALKRDTLLRARKQSLKA